MKISPSPGRSLDVDSSERPLDRECRIVTLYEDFPAAIRAYQSFQDLAHRFSRGRPAQPTSWSFAMLGNPRLMSAIARESADADVIVVAANGDREPPDYVASWIRRLVNQKPGARPVVLALHDDGLTSDAGTAPLCRSLEQIAGERHAKFMCGADLDRQKSHPPKHAAAHVRPESRIHAPRAARRRDVSPTRWFGIND
jgi:hypothetical protein